MLKSTKLSDNPSVGRLVKLWAERYVPDLSTLSLEDGSFNISGLVEAASKEGRTKTVAKVRHLLNLDCEYAGIQANGLFSYLPNIVNLVEAKRLAKFVWQVYEKTLEIYLQQSHLASLQAAKRLATAATSKEGSVDLPTDVIGTTLATWDAIASMPALEMPAVEQLATALEPVLLELQNQHLLAKDKRTIGFVNTQFHFTTRLVINQLTLPEQVLLSPYLKFVEEQVLIPWQRVCAAATKHEFDSPHLAIVQQLLPVSDEIASAVFLQTANLNPHHCSRRGKLSHPGVAASTTRDMNMFQAYLWLCVLEDSMASVEYELLPLCVMVLPSVEVQWELSKQMIQLLIDEIQVYLSPDQINILRPYTQAMQRLFSNPEMKAGL